MSDLFDEPDDATPLDPDEREGLLQTWITYRHELNAAEQTNIAAGSAWAWRSRRDVLTEAFLRDLHKRLFGDVWAWAGTFRTTEKNIGVEPARIAIDIRTALDDARYWTDNGTYPPDEIAIRLHHRLVATHPFPNGNGRTTRLMADLIVVRMDRPAFSWGRENLTDVGTTRARYVAALRAADAHDVEPLLAFARS